MSKLHHLSRRYAKNTIALLLVIAVYALAQPARISQTERERLAAPFRFDRLPLPTLEGFHRKLIREVNPSLKRIAAWISAVGAAVALNDLDGDGLPNDLCYVDPQIDQVVVTPAPGTPQRFKPFALNPSPLPFDARVMAPMGTLPGDFNEDGYLDVLTYYWGRTPIIFLRTKVQAVTEHAPLSREQFVPVELLSSSERWYTNAATQADLDGDGHIDLIFGNYFPDGARILDPNATNGEQMQHSMSQARNGGRNRFFLWSEAAAVTPPVVAFVDATDSVAEDLLHGWTLAIGAADLDGDLLPEIYFANDFGSDCFLYNRSRPGHLRFDLLRGEKTFSTPKSKVLGTDSFKGMGVDFGDLNGDGITDIYISNIAREYALEESHLAFLGSGETHLMQKGIAPYADASEALGLSRSGWGWDARLADFDNDGDVEVVQATGFLKGQTNRWPELHELAMGNDQLLQYPRNWPRFEPGDDLCGHDHNPFFVRALGGRFYDLAREIRLDQPQVSRGLASGDVDGDGRLDFAIANQWETSYFYHNQAPSPGMFLGLRLLLPLAKQSPAPTIFYSGLPPADHLSRAAIGAKVTIYLPGGRRLIAQVDGGNGHSGKRSPELHFGLGEISKEEKLEVEIRWRDAHGQVGQQTYFLTPGWHTARLGR